EAHVLAEQALLRRVVHIDAVRARELDAQGAERIEIAGILAKAVVHRLVGLPVDLRRLQLLAVHVVDVDVLVGEVIRVLLHDRHEIAPHQRHRHGPVRIEIDFRDLAVDVWRRPVRAADHGGVAADRDAVLHRLDLRGRNIHHHVAVAEIAGQRLEAADIGPELRQAHVAGDVEALEGFGAHDAVDRDAVARLEAAHRGLDVGIEDIADPGAGAGIEIAGDGEALAQGHDARMAVAEAKPLDRRHRRPAAAGENTLVLPDRLRRGVGGRGRQRRQRRFRHVDGARGAVVVLAELATLILVDQRLQKLVLAGGARRPDQGWRGERASAEQGEKRAAIWAIAGPAGLLGHRDLGRWRRGAPGARGIAENVTSDYRELSAILWPARTSA